MYVVLSKKLTENIFVFTDETCLLPLGMESGKIKDAAISASSSYDSASVGPHRAR